ncbi:MAG: four helix bundle protein [Patescibacteria group bacterium]|nr:four helix bundle protein [Patescibacteria group bacterium]
MTNERITKYDLEERTAKFAAEIVKLAQSIPENAVTRPIISQLVRAGTSVGANYCEADDAITKKDFIHKISISKKEARETKHWLRIAAITYPKVKERARILWVEAKELHLIFNAIIHSSKKNNKQ